ncbi:hypothetical protein [Novosphingobium malaysiense]|uniref:UrcA family protein n=1 Tax=Novosphingobium malaysiense TaxID=1348853 RepID=A0A0B1ZW04_9SPHN|nr:hypothetical protein [Novosphingobium malaysiense]KHK93337.1 hypothetical protein LK12_03275 [Novosphingobium malaysiense]
MISAILLAVAGLSAPAPASAPTAAYGADTLRSLKGHPALPERGTERKTANLPAACHPDPTKSRICRHLLVQAKEEQRAMRTFADANDAKAAGVSE